MKNQGKSQRHRVALLVETSLGSGRDILRGIARYVRGHEPWILQLEPRGLEQDFPAWLNEWDGDGIILRAQTPEMWAMVRQTEKPAVDVLGVARGKEVPLVHVDDPAVGRLGAQHLLERGFSHFGFYGIVGENWSEARRVGFQEALQEQGCPTHLLETPRHGTQVDDGRQELRRLEKWLQDLPRPAGIMVCSDQRGLMLLEACRRVGAVVPDDIAAIGVDNDEALCEVCNPPLSSINAGHQEVGYQAAAMLDRLMAGEEPPLEPLLVKPTGLVTRFSSDVEAVGDRNILKAVQFIRDHAVEGIDVNDVVRVVPLSRSVLQRRFKEKLGRTIHGEILKTRLKRAQDLLIHTDLTLADIADRVGFRHQEYLGVVFNRHVGITPGGYRKRHRE